MRYSFRPHLFIKEETLVLGDLAIEHLRNGKPRRKIDLRTVRRVQEFNSGMLINENRESVPGITCRLHLTSGRPLMFRSSSYVGPGSKTAPMAKDQTPEFLAFYRKLLGQLASLDPDLPVQQGSSGYKWMFIGIGLFVFLLMAGLGVAILVGSDESLAARLIGSLFLFAIGIGFGYMSWAWAKIYRPQQKTVREALNSL